jgi:deazaflavin-dependent oxidoreductase (nitroreductase family)
LLTSNKLEETMEKFFNRLTIWLYLIRGGGSMAGNTLLLTTTGRRSGKKRTTPLRFIREGNAYVVIGSNAGNDKMPGWYYNLRDHPQVEVQVGRHRFQAKAEVVNGPQRDGLWKAMVAVSPDYEAFQRKTSRVFPVVCLTPEHSIS